MTMHKDPVAIELLTIVGNIVSAQVSRQDVPTTDIPNLISEVYNAFANLGNQPERSVQIEHVPAVSRAIPAKVQKVEDLKPAVPINKSVTPDYIVCLEDGKKLKFMKRHIKTYYGLSPEEYKDKWNLPNDYPMVAESYSEKRSKLAKSLGLGRKPKKHRNEART